MFARATLEGLTIYYTTIALSANTLIAWVVEAVTLASPAGVPYPGRYILSRLGLGFQIRV